MSKKSIAWLLLLALVIPFVLGACGTATTEAPEPVKTEEPEPMVDPSGQTVVFWHPWGTGTVGEGLTALVDEFNATNEWGITVDAVDQGRHSDVEDAMNAAITSGDLPDVVVGYTNALDTWHSVDALIDINTYVNDPDYGLTAAEIDDYYAGVWANGINAAGERVGFPHGQSANVMFYNYTWAQELGFDSPPKTYEELRTQACAAADYNANDDDPDNDGTGGLVLYTAAENVAGFVFALGGDFYSADGMTYDFTKPEFVEVATFWKELWDAGCAFPTESYPNPEFATRKALFTTSSTAGYPYQVSAFEAEDAFHDDVWGFIPFPGKDAQAIDAYAQNTGIVASSPEKELATWLFIKWFTSPEINAKWIEASNYFPIRISAVPMLAAYAADNPLWSVGLDLTPLGVSEPGWASWGTVRRQVRDTFAAIIQGTEADIMSLLEELNASAAEAIEELQ
jgi:multiple sugar transport system substrate-binding protein/sn-glycerol 3-phosphate transport system substrate-binding protein